MIRTLLVGICLTLMILSIPTCVTADFLVTSIPKPNGILNPVADLEAGDVIIRIDSDELNLSSQYQLREYIDKRIAERGLTRAMTFATIVMRDTENLSMILTGDDLCCLNGSYIASSERTAFGKPVSIHVSDTSATGLRRRHLKALLRLASWYEDLGSVSDLEELCAELNSRYSGSIEAEKALVYLERAKVAFRKGLHEESKEDLVEAQRALAEGDFVKAIAFASGMEEGASRKSIAAKIRRKINPSRIDSLDVATFYFMPSEVDPEDILADLSGFNGKTIQLQGQISEPFTDNKNMYLFGSGFILSAANSRYANSDLSDFYGTIIAKIAGMKTIITGEGRFVRRLPVIKILYVDYGEE